VRKDRRDPSTLKPARLVIAIIDENVTEDFIPADFKQQAVFGSPTGRRPDQDEGLRCRRGRRHHQARWTSINGYSREAPPGGRREAEAADHRVNPFGGQERATRDE